MQQEFTTEKGTKVNNNFIPSDNTELYVHYFGGRNSLAANTIRKIMPTASMDEIETLAHDAYARFLEHKMMERFDPTKGNFGGMVYVTARTVATHHLSKKQRNPLTGLYGGSLKCTTEQFEKGVYALDRLELQQAPDEDEIKDERIVFLLNSAALLEKCPESKRDRSLMKLLKMLMAGYDMKEVAAACGVKTSTVHGWCYYLRGLATDTAS